VRCGRDGGELNALPIIHSLQACSRASATFNSITTSRPSRRRASRLDWTNAEHAAARGPDCACSGANNQPRIEARNVPAQQRFEPRFGRVSIKRVVMVGSFRRSVLQQFSQQVPPFVYRSFLPAGVAGRPRRQTTPLVVHHAAHASERQAKVTKRFTMTALTTSIASGASFDQSLCDLAPARRQELAESEPAFVSIISSRAARPPVSSQSTADSTS